MSQVRDSQGFPSVETMPDHGLAAFVGRNGLRTGAGLQVQAVKRIDFAPVFEIATRPIQGMQDSIECHQGLGHVNGAVFARRRNQVPLLQDTVDRGQ